MNQKNKIHLLLVDNYDSFTYNLAELCKKINTSELTIVNPNQVDDDIIKKHNRMILSPGPGLPHETPNLCEIVKKYHQSIPILGICLGLEAIAITFGGKLMPLKEVSHGNKEKINIVDNNDPVFSGINKSFYAGLYHSWCVNPEFFPQNLTINAISDNGIIMGLRHRTLNIYGFQFHPESFMTEYGAELLYNWVNN